ncbi:hypothetical protein CJF31_00011326 [Rutstroemia sp. NJR-2017a BVV2]|nr:hypothetical protein CJF31_00011326 [Rutstroemia sp. NJR-2017a BVV2]
MSVLDYLHATSTSTDYSKILSSISINCVRYNRQTARPTLDIEQKRLQNHEKHELERIAVDRQQMNIALPAQIASERNLQQYTERLKKATENTIAHLDIRDLAEKELLDMISEPTELTGEFREESDYTSVINHIEKGIANDARTQQRSLWRETYFWPMIQQRAKMIGPLPVPPGRKTLITPQEKIAAKQLVLAMGHGICRDNVFKWTSYWRLLSELRLREAISLLLYRSSEFKTHFFRYTKELDMLLSWNHIFDFPLQQLRIRVIAEEGGEFSGKCDIDNKRIFQRLRMTQSDAWANNLSVWGQDQLEYKNFLANHSMMATSGKSNEHILRHGIKGKLASNRSVFVGIIPYEGESENRVIGGKPASTKLYSISPLVSVDAGDFLGIFSGKLRFVNQRPPRAVKGPVPGLWLDYSEIPGKLNRMKVARPGEKTNVCLAWEGVNEAKGEKSFCQYWRILVVATREILPFDQLIPRRSPEAGSSIIEAAKTVYDAAGDAKGQPEVFPQVAARLSLVIEILRSAEERASALDETVLDAIEHTLELCKAKPENLNKIFQKVIRKDDDKWFDRYKKALSTLGKGSKVEDLMEEILKDTQLLACEKLMGIVTEA